MALPTITPEKVVKAYEETGMIPDSGQLLKALPAGSIAGCGLGVMGCALGLIDKSEAYMIPLRMESYMALVEFYGAIYVNSFTHGFDRAFVYGDEIAMEFAEKFEGKSFSERHTSGFFDGVECGVKAHELRELQEARRAEEREMVPA